ncbi:MAG: complex I subunit 5 family protein [Rhodobacterales bacterium]
MLWTGPFLPLAALIWPLIVAGLITLPALRGQAVRLLPLAPLPALVAALSATDALTTAPDLLMGVTLQLDASGRLLLGLTATLWLIAGLAAQPMAGKPDEAVFSGFWCLTLAGNMAVFMAQDIVTFYVAFAAVSLAAWFLVVHDRSATALRAGQVYIVMAILGEVCLLLGLLYGADAAGSLEIPALRAALAGPDAPALALPLLIIGFGIKAGMVPLHVWLPLAHPAAPVAASAVLSGAIVKAGLFGMIQFMPQAQAEAQALAMPGLVALGMIGAFGAAIWGLTQSNPKAVLAYSTISQMGLMILMVGTNSAARDTVAYFALHHGLAKGALFLLCGVMLVAATRAQRVLCIAVACFVAASVAGLPLTGGALAKSAVKSTLPEMLSLVLSLSSITTSLILLWFLYRLWAVPHAKAAAPLWAARLSLPVLAGGLAIAAPWVLWPSWADTGRGYNLAGQTLFDAVWPVLACLPLAILLWRCPLPEHPPGDLLQLLRFRPPGPIHLPKLPDMSRSQSTALTILLNAVRAGEKRLTEWPLISTAMALLVLVLLAALMKGPS